MSLVFVGGFVESFRVSGGGEESGFPGPGLLSNLFGTQY
jgi:hypothetical protein